MEEQQTSTGTHGRSSWGMSVGDTTGVTLYPNTSTQPTPDPSRAD